MLVVLIQSVQLLSFFYTHILYETFIFVSLAPERLIVFHSLVFSIRFSRKYASHAVTYLEFFESDILEAKRQTIDLEIITEDELVGVYQFSVIADVMLTQI